MIEVRPVTPAEHGLVGTLVLEAYDAVGSVSPAYRDEIADTGRRIDDETSVLVAVEDDEVLGSITLVSACSPHFEHAGHGDGGFRILAVSPAAQGRGVGRRLLDAAIDHGRRQGWRRLAITTMEWMHAAQSMYTQAGFVRRPDLDVRYGSGIGHCYVLDLDDDAAGAFPAPGPVPDEPRPYVAHDDRPPGC